MPRPRQGIGFVQRQVVYTGVRLRDGGRTVWPVATTDAPPPGVPLGVPWAKAVSLAYQARYDRKEWDPGGASKAQEPAPAVDEETVAQYAERWFADRAQRLRHVTSDRYRFAKHVLPVIGNEPIASVVAARIEAVRDSLDAKIAAGELSGKTALNTWSLVTMLFRDASRSKRARGLLVRKDDPCVEVAPPESGDERQGPCLYPSEYLALARCEAVDLGFRRLVTLAIYQYLRAGELEALACNDVNLDHDVIHVHQAAHYETGESQKAKTQAGQRHVPIEPAARPLLTGMVDAAEKIGRVVPEMPLRKKGAAMLREALAKARCTRAELFASDKTRRPVNFHDLRATGITWRAIRGDAGEAIMEQAGHTDFKTTRGYIRTARALRASFGEPFPPIPVCLLEGYVTGSVTEGADMEEKTQKHRCEEGELNPTGSHEESPEVTNCLGFRCSGELFKPLDERFVTGSVTPVTPQINLVHSRAKGPPCPPPAMVHCPHCAGSGRVPLVRHKAVRS